MPLANPSLLPLANPPLTLAIREILFLARENSQHFVSASEYFTDMPWHVPTRKHIRLRNFDYSSANAYFITICVDNFECRLGKTRNGIVGLSEIGNVATCCLQNIPGLREHVVLDEFVVMPNHIHCIIEIKRSISSASGNNEYAKPVTASVSVIVNQFKGAVKKWCNENGFKDFKWQGRFYDRVIRDDNEYWAIKNYIINNPRNWRRDLPLANPG